MLTVAFASFNGVETLPLMLEAMLRLQSPEGGWQLVAVDNASTDGTRSLLDSYCDRLPLIVLEQPEQGKSKALNLALECVAGDLLVLTDDDVVPRPDWLRVWRTYADAHSEFGVFGGTIQPHWLQPPPQWLERAIPLGLAFAQTHGGIQEGRTKPLFIAGANMAVRAEALRAGLRFDERRGPTGMVYAMGEDTKFAFDADALGFAAAHCPDAVVEHIVLPYQYEKGWLLKRAYRYGQSRAIEDIAICRYANTVHYFGAPRWLLPEYLRHRMKSAVEHLRGDKAGHMAASWEASYLAGYLSQYRRSFKASRVIG